MGFAMVLVCERAGGGGGGRSNCRWGYGSTPYETRLKTSDPGIDLSPFCAFSRRRAAVSASLSPLPRILVKFLWRIVTSSGIASMSSKTKRNLRTRVGKYTRMIHL